ncbi:MAG: hypothetical protein WA821_16040 [Anaerolineales bacterium]
MTTTLQQFMVETFSETELLILCESDEQLQKAMVEFSDSMSLAEKVRRLINFCKRRGLSGILWAKVREERKEQWAAHQMPGNEPAVSNRMPSENPEGHIPPPANGLPQSRPASEGQHYTAQTININHIYGDSVSGDKIDRSIEVGNIQNANGIAVGDGAQSNVNLGNGASHANAPAQSQARNERDKPDE